MHLSQKLQSDTVTPSRVCELKFQEGGLQGLVDEVTPSRVCELKYAEQQGSESGISGHTLTGV